MRSYSFKNISEALSKFRSRSIFTVRPKLEGGGYRGDEGDRLSLLGSLTRLRPAFLDVELSTLEENGDLIAKGPGHVMIVSWHDTVETPRKARLISIMARATSYGGLVKIVTNAKSALDNLEVLSLYDEPGPPPVAFCMGDRGIFSRIMAMERGSPLAYASLPGEPTAPGQLSLVQLLAIRRRLHA